MDKVLHPEMTEATAVPVLHPEITEATDAPAGILEVEVEEVAATTNTGLHPLRDTRTVPEAMGTDADEETAVGSPWAWWQWWIRFESCASRRPG